MLGTYGNFQTDSNFDGFGDGWALTSIDASSMSYNTQSMTTGASGDIITNALTSTLDHVYYYCGFFKCDTASTMRLFLSTTGFGSGQPIDYLPQSNDFVFVSNRHKATASGVGSLTLQHYLTSATVQTSLKNIKVVDLTETFGSGNEPTKQKIDEYMQDNPNYFVTQSI
jgi:hypothetical protein